MKLSLRFTIPIVLAVFTCVIAFWVFFTSGQVAVKNTETHLMKDITNMMTRLQEATERALRKGEWEWLQKDISGYGSVPHLKTLVLIDAAGKVIAGTKLGEIDQNWKKIISHGSIEIIEKQAELAKTGYAGTTFLSADKQCILGVYPVKFASKTIGSRNVSVGILLAQVDLSVPKARALALVKMQVYQFVFILSLLMVLLGIFFHFQMTKRVRKLVSTMNQFANGDFKAPVGVNGRDELSTLAESIRKMATRRDQDQQRMNAYAKKLEESNQDLQDFAHIASHDLQEPLRKILSFGDLLKSSISKEDDKGMAHLERIQKSTARMKSFIEDLLQFTQLGTKENACEPTDLNGVVQRVLEDLETRMVETQGTVHIKSLPVIEADAMQMYQLFLNLIGNGLKFHREGVGPVISLDSSRDADGMWEITVEDNGVGIEEQYVDKIFKPFERLHGRGTYEGTGIGLTICNKIVTRHGGEISVKQHSEYGVTFRIRLPEKQIKSNDASLRSSLSFLTPQDLDMGSVEIPLFSRNDKGTGSFRRIAK